MWFQQVDTTPHFQIKTIQLLNENIMVELFQNSGNNSSPISFRFDTIGLFSLRLHAYFSVSCRVLHRYKDKVCGN